MTSPFEILEYKNLVSQNSVNRGSIESLSVTEIFEMAEAIVALTEQPEPNECKTIFAHSASLSLGGSREGCSSLRCRTLRVNELARFALMYSDRVYINHFFLDYAHKRTTFNNPRFRDEDDLRRRFYEDLHLLMKLKPLLEKGFVRLFTPATHSCPKCVAKSYLGPDAKERLDQEFNRLAEEYFSNTLINLEKRHGRYVLRCVGPEPYFEHGGINYPRTNIPEPITSMPRIMKRVMKGESVLLSKAVRKKLNLHKDFAGQVVRNIAYDLASAQVLKTSFLTDRSLHISFLQSISKDHDVEHRNAIAFEHLTSVLPFVEDVEIRDLMKLRSREEEAFIKYRHALNEAIDKFRSNSKDFTEKDARTLYSDIIAPKLSSLEQSIKQAKRDLVTKPLKSIGALVGVLSFGLYTGFLPTEVIEMAKALGLSKIVYDVLEKTMSLKDTEQAVKHEDLYFLWKVKNASQVQ
jgi:hypothetical protein